MKTALRLSVLMAGLCCSAGLLAAESPGCRGVAFSETVLQKFPRAQEACLDVVTKGEKQYAVFKADLQSVQGNTVRVRVRLPDGSYSGTKSIKTKPGLKVLVDGKPYGLDELALHQELTTYIRVDQPLIALAPADQSTPVDPVPLMEPDLTGPQHLASAAPVMPETASQAMGTMLMGLFFCAVALALRIAKRRDR